MTGTCLALDTTERHATERRKRLPRVLRARLRPGEAVRHFVPGAGDAAAGEGVAPGERWLLVTDERVLFGGTSARRPGQGRRSQHESGSIPISALSAILVAADKEATPPPGGPPAAALRLTSGGVETLFTLASVDEAVRLQALLEDLRRRPRAIRASGATVRCRASPRTER
ncbi:MAG TPA: hypothetical protein VK911_03070 [Vicinamibacterales bacterium]|nr:hypothetical protein [Vicinamibacterales bacterium]